MGWWSELEKRDYLDAHRVLIRMLGNEGLLKNRPIIRISNSVRNSWKYKSMSSKFEKRLSSFDDLTLFYKRFLRLIGILPLVGRDFKYIGDHLLVAWYFSWSSLYWTMFVFYTINTRKALTIDSICESVAVIGVVLRYYLLLMHRLEFTYLLDEAQEIWQMYDHEDDRLTVRHFERKIRLIFKFILAGCVFIDIMYSAVAITSTLKAAHLNDTRALRYLPYKWYSENGPNLWPGYKLILILQATVQMFASIVATSVDTAGPLLIMIAAGYLRALRNRLLRISDNDKADLELVTCARIHQRILDFCTKIEKITKSLFFVILIGTVYNTSLVGIKLAGSDPDRYKYVALAIINLSALFICQWAPDHLIQESTAISTAVHSVSVIWMRRRVGKLVILIIARSQRPVQMTAAGIVNLSLEKFGSMLMSAFSFFTALRNFN